MMTDSGAELGHKQSNQPCCYFEIRVREQLSSEWSDWFENLDIRLLEDGDTLLSGPIVDQAALMGILNKLNRLNLTLLSLNEVSPNQHVEEGESNGTAASIES
jgi:hypothetical protein